MSEYKILAHPSDLKLKIFGITRKELFLNALQAMFLSMKPQIKTNKRKIKRKFRIHSVDFPSLLIDFLSEALYLSDLYDEVYLSARISHLNDKKIEGEFLGEKISGLGLEIKAVTYHKLKIKKVKNNWQATILFDL